MVLKVQNTLTREKEVFEPLGGDRKVGMYVCGPTVYDHCHIGHARSYVAFDVIRRYLEFKGYLVNYVQNFTDVDDKIINRARELGVPPLDLSKNFTESYFEDMARLNVRRANFHPLASEIIPEMLETISTLIDKGNAYVSGDGSVYFSVESAANIFGQLTHQKLEDMLDGARVEVDESKKNPKDFALWKAGKEGEISWDSPWGPGRPGWHIECSTMATTYIGPMLDIHGGGMDLIFPHHESEILQSQSYHGRKFAKYWLHNGFININSEKMSKSLDNFFTIKEVLTEFEPMVVRFFLVNTHYRREIDYSKEALEEATRAFLRIRIFRRSLGDILGAAGSLPAKTRARGDAAGEPHQEVAGFREAFIRTMDDDFNTRGAVAVLFDMVAKGNRLLEETGSQPSQEHLETLQTYATCFDELAGILGIDFLAQETVEAGGQVLDGVMELLVQMREKARAAKDWKTADEIRNRLKELGIVIEDKGTTSAWRLEN